MIGVLSLLLNLLIVGLLMATISYCWVLNKRIKILQDSKSELASLLQHFDAATTRASESIVALQSVSKKIGENIQGRVDKANFLMDDLAFMIEKGERIANKLDANFAVTRARSRVDSVVDELAGGEKAEILEKSAVNTVLKSAPVLEKNERQVTQKAAKEKTNVSLEAVLERVIGRVKQSTPKPANGNRSKAEQELLDMIRAGIKG